MFRQLLGLISGSTDTLTFALTLFSYLVILFIAFPFHECAHGVAALLLGDRTAKNQGRITLNPIAHLDLFGTISMALFGIGWAKPVPVNPRNCSKVKSPKTAMALTAAAGPLSNLLLAYIFMILMKICLYTTALADTPSQCVYLVLNTIVSINLYLAVFNLLPIPPFDGSRLFLAFLPTKTYFKIMQYERYIMIAIMILLWSGVLSLPLNFISNLLYNGLDFCSGFIDLLMR